MDKIKTIDMDFELLKGRNISKEEKIKLLSELESRISEVENEFVKDFFSKRMDEGLWRLQDIIKKIQEYKRDRIAASKK